MNKKDAQFILESYRPGTEDDSDPLFSEALKVAKSNPELLHWLKTNGDMDREISRALQGITPPPELKDSILKTHPFESKKKEASAAPHTTHPSWWQSPWTLSMAASLALMLFVAISVIEPRKAEADWNVARILESASAHSSQHVPSSGEYVSISTLQERLANGDLPKLTSRTSTEPVTPETQGYALLDWDELPVERWTFSSEIGEIYHLYAIDGEALTPEPSIPAPAFRQMGDTALAAWTANDVLYILAHKGSITELKSMLKNVGKTDSALPTEF